MTMAALALVIEAPVARIRETLLAAPQLPAWNPAFVRVEGPARARLGTEYALQAIRGLRGTLTYTTLDAETVTMAWNVPLLAEVGTWDLVSHDGPDRTRVTHSVERHGALAALLRSELQTLPALRLERLAQRVAVDGRR